MDYQRQNNGLLTFLEHWWFLVIVLSAAVASQLVSILSRLTGTPWMWCYGISLFLGVIGIVLIGYAKFPLYQRRRFFTFGSKALPENRRPFYRWGYRLAIFAVTLLSALLLSAQ